MTCTVLAMHIIDKSQFTNPDTVEVVWDNNGDVLNTSRAPVPYCKEFTPDLVARRIHGIFAFKWSFYRNSIHCQSLGWRGLSPVIVIGFAIMA